MRGVARRHNNTLVQVKGVRRIWIGFRLKSTRYVREAKFQVGKVGPPDLVISRLPISVVLQETLRDLDSAIATGV